ncbi:hypothetical protein FXE84_01370 [Vibrio cholerae]|uniref:hypothetical protein n=1 Tax=Vibrio cholerae TaxID=666 RepID=UPI0004E310D9|nr:hypothetical protein [Vibrio cholerae]KFE28965.1 hypothetical protein DN30_314 [Vibrio cholerae]TXY44016.1 hypothetical protein FXE84_01370 [Vibrio cholerae]
MKHEINSELLQERIPADEIEATKYHEYSVEPVCKNHFIGVVPAPLVKNFGKAFTSESEAWSWMVQVRETHPDGKSWAIATSSKHHCAKCLYELLSDVCINDEEEVDSDFLHFESGTPRVDIWHWLESEFDVSLAELEKLVERVAA